MPLLMPLRRAAPPRDMRYAPMTRLIILLRCHAITLMADSPRLIFAAAAFAAATPSCHVTAASFRLRHCQLLMPRLIFQPLSRSPRAQRQRVIIADSAAFSR